MLFHSATHFKLYFLIKLMGGLLIFSLIYYHFLCNTGLHVFKLKKRGFVPADYILNKIMQWSLVHSLEE